MSALASEYIRTWIEDNIVPELGEDLDPDAAKPFVEQLVRDAEDAGINREELEEDGDDLADLILQAMSEASPEEDGSLADSES